MTAIQYSGPSTKASNPASATPDPSPDTHDDARRPPLACNPETTRPTAAAISRITPRITAAFQKICGDAQASRPVNTAAPTHGSAVRDGPVHRGGLFPVSARNVRTRKNTRPATIGSMTSVTAAPAPYCSWRIAFE